MRRALLAIAALAAGCTVGALDLAGKKCPCIDGYRCDAAQNLCVANPGGGDGGSGAIAVGNLRVDWTTPNTIHWVWDASGPPDQLQTYQLVVANSAADVAARSGSAKVWGAADNPELGRFYLPRTNGMDPTIATSTDGHTPSTSYFGQLYAIDTAGLSSVSNVAGSRTTDPALGAVVIFHDADTPGYSIPSSFALSPDRPYQGSMDYEFHSACTMGETACFENLRRQQLGMKLDPISMGSFLDTAYLEFAIASDAKVTSYWCDMHLWFGDGSSSDGIAAFHPWTIRSNDQYRVIQVPLRALQDANGPVTYPSVQSGLFEFQVGGLWEDGATVRVDEVRIAY